MAENRVAVTGQGNTEAIVTSAGALTVTGTVTATAAGTQTVVPLAAESVTNYGTAAAPAADAAVATIASGSLPAGTYDFDVVVAVTGTVAAATDTDNMNFREGATVVGRLPIIITSTTPSTIYFGPYRFRRTLDGSTAVTVNAVANSTASSVYRANIIATRVI